MKSAEVGASVEGESIEVQCRKYQQLLPYKHPKIGSLVYPFKLSIFGKVSILKPLNDVVSKIREESLVAVGDEIQGESITGHCARALPKAEVKHATASHKASFVKTRGHSFAQVATGLRELLQRKKIEAE